MPSLRKKRALLVLLLAAVLFVLGTLSRTSHGDQSPKPVTNARTVFYFEGIDVQPLIDFGGNVKITFCWERKFEEIAYTWNNDARLPLAIIEARNEKDVVKCLQFFTKHPQFELRIKSGGNSYGAYGVTKNGIVISVVKLKLFEVDPVSNIVTMGAGLNSLELLEKLAPLDLNMVTSMCAKVSAGGLYQGGGVGLLARKLGLAADSVISFRIVLWDGQVLEVDRGRNPELFWALQGGGGGNFGVVTQITAQAVKGPDVQVFGSCMFDTKHVRAFLKRLTHGPPLPREVFFSFEGGLGQPMQDFLLASIVDDEHKYPVAETMIKNLVQPLLPPDCNLKLSRQSMMNWTQHLSILEGYLVNPHSAFLLPEDATPDNIDLMMNELTALLKDDPTSFIRVQYWGGALADIPTSTPLPTHSRRALFTIEFIQIVYNKPGSPHRSREIFEKGLPRPQKTWEALHPSILKAGFINYIVPSLDVQRFGEFYYGKENFEKLKQIKNKYDPHNRFRYPYSIPLN